jgi:hypothetical protein
MELVVHRACDYCAHALAPGSIAYGITRAGDVKQVFCSIQCGTYGATAAGSRAPS